MSNLKLVKDTQDKKFMLKSKGQKHAVLEIYSNIGSSFWDEGITAQQVADAIKEFGEIDQLDVRINSFGGDVFQGVAIYNRLRQLSAKKTVYVDGIAASIASIIAMAGDEIVMGEGTQMMIHKPLTMTYGNALAHEENINILDSIEEEMVGIYAKKTKRSRSDIKRMLAAETWMKSTVAVEEGFATKVDAGLKVAAVADKSLEMFSKVFRNCPTQELLTRNKEIKEDLQAKIKNIGDFLARR